MICFGEVEVKMVIFFFIRLVLRLFEDKRRTEVPWAAPLSERPGRSSRGSITALRLLAPVFEDLMNVPGNGTEEFV